MSDWLEIVLAIMATVFGVCGLAILLGMLAILLGTLVSGAIP